MLRWTILRFACEDVLPIILEHTSRELISQIGSQQPVPVVLVFTKRTGVDTRTRDSELRTARSRESVRNRIGRMQLLPSVDVEVLLLFLLDHIVVSRWTSEMVPVWAAWVVMAAGWEVADAVDMSGREAGDGDGGVEVEEDVVVPG